MTQRELEEYRALRATIRQRGTTRVWLFAAGLTAWAALAVATAALAALPVATFLPLLVLAATFEGVFSLHTGVERVGRYVQVFFESPADPGWERRVMLFGERFPGSGSDPLFCALFWLAAVVNILPALFVDPLPVEWTVVGAGHLLFTGRVAYARQRSRRQRAADLERFQKLQ